MLMDCLLQHSSDDLAAPKQLHDRYAVHPMLMDCGIAAVCMLHANMLQILSVCMLHANMLQVLAQVQQPADRVHEHSITGLFAC